MEISCGWRARYTKRPGERASSWSATIKGTRCISGSRTCDVTRAKSALPDLRASAAVVDHEPIARGHSHIR